MNSARFLPPVVFAASAAFHSDSHSFTVLFLACAGTEAIAKPSAPKTMPDTNHTRIFMIIPPLQTWPVADRGLMRGSGAHSGLFAAAFKGRFRCTFQLRRRLVAAALHVAGQSRAMKLGILAFLSGRDAGCVAGGRHRALRHCCASQPERRDDDSNHFHVFLLRCFTR